VRLRPAVLSPLTKRFDKGKANISFLRACIASAFRFVSGIYFYNSDDSNYYFSSIALWVVAEMTCGFIVLCAPSVPAAISLLLQSGLFSGISSRKRSEPRIKLKNMMKSRTGTSTSNDNQAGPASELIHNTSPWHDGVSDEDRENIDGTIKMVNRTSQRGSVHSSYKWLGDIKDNISSNNHSKASRPKKPKGERSSHGHNDSGLSRFALAETIHSSLSTATSTEQLRSSSPEDGNDSRGDMGAASGAGGILCTTQIVTTEDFVPTDEHMKEISGWRSPWEKRDGDEDQDQELGVSVRVL
jgi:hypothetical protein